MTELDPGSNWNTMPSHTHERRMEIYTYFELPEGQVVFHMCGAVSYTHLIQTVQQVPDTQHVLDTQSTVILAVTGAAVAGAFLPQLTAVVGADKMCIRDSFCTPLPP